MQGNYVRQIGGKQLRCSSECVYVSTQVGKLEGLGVHHLEEPLVHALSVVFDAFGIDVRHSVRGNLGTPY